MAEVQAPDLQVNTTSPTVATARGMVPNDFQVAVVQAVTGSASEINQMPVTKQSPTPQAKLTSGELMHLYVAGAGGPDTKTATPPAATAIIVIQFVVILALVLYCFVMGR